MTGLSSFFAAYEIWRDALVVAVLAAALLGYLGVWVVLKRVTWVPLALTQASSLGIVGALYIWALIGEELHHDPASVLPTLLDPAGLSVVFALVAAAFFARQSGRGSEAVVLTYLIGSALVLIIGGFVRQDLHDLESVLFGSAVLVETIQIVYVGAAGLAVVLVHALLHRRFLFVSYDPDAAGAAGLPIYATELWLYASIALMISTATRAIGALPAFGLMILPALAGLHVAKSLRGAFALAVGIGALAAAAGYYLAFVAELPAGAAMVGLAGGVYGVARLATAFGGRIHGRRGALTSR